MDTLTIKSILQISVAEDLIKIIKEANKTYREGNPTWSDYAYDKFVDRLRELNPGHGWFKKSVQDSVVRKKVKLPYEMYSLDKLKSFQDIEEWLKKKVGNDNIDDIEIVITPKLDGLSIQRNIFTGESFTRGNGVEGEHCTQHINEIDLVELSTLYKPLLIPSITRGEVCFTNENWEEFKKNFPSYKSSRNTATGLLKGYFNSLDRKKYQYLSYICYDLCGGNDIDKNLQLEWLNENVNTVHIPFKCIAVKYLCEKYLKKLFDEWSYIFPIDGLVLDLNSAKYRRGQETNNNPTYQKSYKHPSFSEEKITKIIEIERHVNRYGTITPVCVVEPVELSGAEINRVNGINMSYIYDWGLFPGQHIRILRSGEVIPKITEVEGVKIPFREEFIKEKDYVKEYFKKQSYRKSSLKYSYYEEFIDESSICPSCSSVLSWDNTFTNLVCTNKSCKERCLQSVIEFWRILGIKNFGENTFRQLHENGRLNLNYLFKIEPFELLGLEGWAETSANQFCNEIKRILGEKIPLARLLYASGYFEGLGEKTLQLILDNVENYIDPTTSDLLQIKGISEISAEKYKNGMYRFTSTNLLHYFKTYIYTPQQDKIEGNLSNEIIVFSGFRDKELEQKLKSQGAIVSDNMSKSTTLLIIKDELSTSSKIKQAQKQNIKILTKQQLEQQL